MSFRNDGSKVSDWRKTLKVGDEVAVETINHSSNYYPVKRAIARVEEVGKGSNGFSLKVSGLWYTNFGVNRKTDSIKADSFRLMPVPDDEDLAAEDLRHRREVGRSTVCRRARDLEELGLRIAIRDWRNLHQMDPAVLEAAATTLTQVADAVKWVQQLVNGEVRVEDKL